MEHEKIYQLGRAVIETQAQMVSKLTDRIDQNFATARQHMLACKGRIAVMGVGKSGHIGRKIAATFASTGSPAFFIHPGEAKHGDLGMITRNDVILAISYSGQSEEIIAILPFIKRFDVPLITLTGNPRSSLAKAATINIDVSVEKEACPLGLAPTSSTTAALVMGDALAMTLLDRRGFTENDFALSHPGGSLGRRLLLMADEIMHQQEAMPIVSMDAAFKEALIVMTQKKLGMTTVVNATGELVGVFTDGDVRRSFDQAIDVHQTPIKNLMTTHPKTIHRGTLAAEALAIMENFKITALVIIDEKHRPVGVIHIHDLLKAGIA